MSQFVVSHGNTSCLCFISFRLPQASILGPVLFVLYVNEIVMSATISPLTINADDIQLIISISTDNCDNNYIDRIILWTVVTNIT